MTSRDFAYWLQGLFELGEPLTLNKKQTELIRRHLAMVFIHEIDPSMGDEEHQGKLQATHAPEIVLSELEPTIQEVSILSPPPRPLFLDQSKPGLIARC